MQAAAIDRNSTIETVYLRKWISATSFCVRKNHIFALSGSDRLRKGKIYKECTI